MKSVLIIGLGRFGIYMSKKLIEEGNEVLAIDKDEVRAESSLKYVRNVEIGDCTNEEFIRSLGVANFDICVVAIGDNFPSALEITVLLKDFGAKFVIARADTEVHKKLLLRNGADYVIYAEKETAERLAMKFGAKNVFDYIELTPEYAIYEISVPTPWVGKSIIEKSIRSKYNISILATKVGDVISPLPSPDHVFRRDETLIIMGHSTDVAPLLK